MPLRCLLFSSNEEMIQPIWQVLADLGIEGEYCQSAVDAVERVTTQLFQIVITDWEDQPEAAFLLKTARDLKAAQRPLTLAIVSDDTRLPEALQAGANSVLLKPIRAEQVRDTMTTACELLRAKQPSIAPQPVVTQPAVTMTQSEMRETVALAAAASAGAVSTPPSAIPVSEKAFRAGEFLQSPGSTPGVQFDTECEIQKSMDQAVAAEVDALTELEPMASAVVAAPAVEPAKPQEALTGWASLQARLTRSAPPAPLDASPKNELLSYGESPSYGVESGSVAGSKEPTAKQSQSEAESEAALFSYMAGKTEEEAEPAEQMRPRRNPVLLLGALAAVCVVLAVVPRTRQGLPIVYRNAVHASRSWLNPQPVPVPQAATQHESFGQDSDEYKFPVATNIPDATTDASQIRVLPVVDPTAKPGKGTEASSAQTTTGENVSTDQNQSGSGEPAPAVQSPTKEEAATGTGEDAGSAASSGGLPSAVQVETNPSVPQEDVPQQKPSLIVPPGQVSVPPHVASPNSAAIPSSLKSEIASMTPEASGAKPVESAMSSIEPVRLPESAALELLVQPVDAIYPEAAKAGGERGSVVLQVLIGRDGTVQDAKFLQGSLVFARAAIDAVKQWRFKPYSMNGRAVSVQSLITLNFKPPA
jgi:TonB family protein